MTRASFLDEIHRPTVVESQSSEDSKTKLRVGLGMRNV
jgi:hypothetical protein